MSASKLTFRGVPIRCLTLVRPWPACFRLGKDVENRTWPLPRWVDPNAGVWAGLHAGKRLDRGAFPAIGRALHLYSRAAVEAVKPHLHEPGEIRTIALFKRSTTAHPSRWAVPGQHQWVVDQQVELQGAIQAGPGALGLWYDPEVAEQIRDAIERSQVGDR